MKSISVYGDALINDSVSLDYMLDHDWQLFLSVFMPNMKTTALFNANIKPYFEIAINAGLTVWADIEGCCVYNIEDSAPTRFETDLGAGMDGFESIDIEGYAWEVGPQEEVEWLRDRTTRKLWQWWGIGWFNDTSPIANPAYAGKIWEASLTGLPPDYQVWRTDIDDRMALVDYNSYEFYQLSRIPEAIRIHNWLDTNYPALHNGITTTRGDAIVPPQFDWNPWSLTNYYPSSPLTSAAERKRLMTQGVYELKKEFGVIENLVTLEVLATGYPTMKDYCEYLDRLHLQIEIETDELSLPCEVNQTITEALGWDCN